MKKDKRKINDGLISAVILISLALTIALIWTVLAKSINSEFIFPSLTKTLQAFVRLFGDGYFYVSLLMTLVRSVTAFFVSFIFAFVFSIISYNNKIAKKVISPMISIIRALPTIAIILLIMVWTNKFIAPIIVTSLVVFPTIYANLLSLLEEINKDEITMCRLFKVSKKKILFSVIVPQLVPSILVIIGTGISLNIKLMVAGEVIVATSKSLGNMLNICSIDLEIAKMFAIVFVCIILGLIIEAVFNLLGKKLVKWK